MRVIKTLESAREEARARAINRAYPSAPEERAAGLVIAEAITAYFNECETWEEVRSLELHYKEAPIEVIYKDALEYAYYMIEQQRQALRIY